MDQQQHNGLAKDREVVRRVDDDQARNADGRRGREECVEERERFSRGRNRQPEEQRADGNQARETDGEELRRRELLRPAALNVRWQKTLPLNAGGVS